MTSRTRAAAQAALVIGVAALCSTGSGSAARPAPAAAVKPTVHVSPSSVQRGRAITVTGRRWPKRVAVQLLIGPPRSEADPVGSVRTTGRGSFVRHLRLSVKAEPGPRVLLACRRECRIKASARFRITR